MAPTATATLELELERAPEVRREAVVISGLEWTGRDGATAIPCRVLPRSKRVLDVAGAAVLLLLALPVLVVSALAVKLTDGGPVFFRQRRIGFGGQSFKMYKLRTMSVGAEALAPRLAAADYTDGLLFRVPADPRVTAVGRVLRRTAIDELPQLWNVLRGEMSLVGPRPLPASEEDFTRFEHLRHSVKPGVTGAWQVAGGNDLPWQEMIELDLRYVEELTLGRDLAILVRTVPALISRVGPS